MVPDPLPEILRTLTALLTQGPRGAAMQTIDFASVVKAIHAIPVPLPVTKEWTFTVYRNSYGVIETVRAKPRSDK